MSMLWKIIGWVLSVSGLLVQAGPPQIRVVTAIRLEVSDQTGSRSCTLTDRESMHRMMNYLRQLDPYLSSDIAEDTFRTGSAHITVEYSDGNCTHYRQIYTEYLQTDNGPWKRIDPEDGAGLYGIMACIWPDSGI